MATRTVRARASRPSFAHLLGLRPAAAAPRAEDKKDGTPDDEPEGAKADDMVDCPACDGSGEDENGDACDACDGDGEVSKDEAKKIKKDMKAAAEDDEECEDEKSDDEATASAARAGRAFERARCMAIFADPAAAVRPDLAAHLAFNGKLSAKAARELLGAAAAGQTPSPQAARAARSRVHLGPDAPGAEAPKSGPQGAAAAIVAAAAKARGETPA